jgi:hypothetical protein
MNDSAEGKTIKRRRNRKGNAGATSASNGSKQNDPTSSVAESSDATSLNELLEETKTNVNKIYSEVVGTIGARFQFKDCPSKGEIFSTPMVVLCVAPPLAPPFFSYSHPAPSFFHPLVFCVMVFIDVLICGACSLGNHSSGKSTFVNFLLNEEELQTTGQVRCLSFSSFSNLFFFSSF